MTMHVPRFSLTDAASFIDFQMCNVTVQRLVPNYRAKQCAFWEKLCADPTSELTSVCN
jgi:hypothetical protein